jgi:hypothetical protein
LLTLRSSRLAYSATSPVTAGRQQVVERPGHHRTSTDLLLLSGARQHAASRRWRGHLVIERPCTNEQRLPHVLDVLPGRRERSFCIHGVIALLQHVGRYSPPSLLPRHGRVESCFLASATRPRDPAAKRVPRGLRVSRKSAPVVPGPAKSTTPHLRSRDAASRRHPRALRRGLTTASLGIDVLAVVSQRIRRADCLRRAP